MSVYKWTRLSEWRGFLAPFEAAVNWPAEAGGMSLRGFPLPFGVAVNEVLEAW